MRVLRDDKYIARMLQYARIFHSTFTMKKQVPPDNFAADLYPDYDAFLQDTKRMFGVFFSLVIFRAFVEPLLRAGHYTYVGRCVL